MATHIGIGFSQRLNIKEAAEDAANQAKEINQQTRIDLVIALSTIHYKLNEFLPILHQIFKETKVIGSSTAGIITSNIIATHGLAVLTITSDDTHFGIDSMNNLNSFDLKHAGNILARNLVRSYGDHPRQALLYFVDGLITNNASIIEGLQEILGTVFPIIGAGSSDDFHFQETHQFCQNEIMTNGIAGLLIGGHLTIGINNKHGWKPLGKPRFVNKTEGNIIRTIDGKPAATIYDEYFGEEAKNLRSTKLGHMAILYPLGIYLKDDGEYLLRNAINILNDGSIICQGQIPKGAEVHLMISNIESCIQAAVDASLNAQSNLMGKEPTLIVIIESLTRHKLLGRSAFQEVKAIKEVFGYSTPIIGMYSNSEICPTRYQKDTNEIRLQNESITILAIA